MRRAWLLHALLIASLILTPSGRLVHADSEDGYDFDGEYETEFQVNVWAPDGTDNLSPGDTRQVLASVQLTTWEIWRNAELGTSDRRNPVSQPSQNEISFSILAPGRGSVNPESATTDGNGMAEATFTPGPGISVVEVRVAGSEASGSVTFSAEEETWQPVREERLLSASLSADAATDGVGNGETRDVTVSAQYQTWTIYRSNYSAEEPRDFGNTPAIGAQIDWSIAEGDGSLATIASSSPTNGQGLASANLTMADARTVVRADVTFAETDQTYATLTFTPLETWAKSDISEIIPSLSLSVAGSTDELAPGNQRLVTANVLGEYYDLYVSNFGNTKWEYSHTAPQQGAQIGFSIIAGDGLASRTTGFTDADGNLTTLFTMGHQFSKLQAQLDNMATTVDFSPVPEVFTYQRTDDVLSLDWVRVDGGPSNGVPRDEIRTLSAGVIVSTYDVYVSNLGNEWADLIASGPASGASVGFTVTSGDGILSAESAITDENGNAGVGFTMGRQSVVVHVEVAGSGADLELSCPPPQWTFSHREMTVAVEMSASDTTTEVPDRAVRTVNAHATFEAWEVWVNALNEDETEVRNSTSGAADGATVDFSIEEPSDGRLTNAATRTNATGDATANFTMGTQTARVWAVVGFGGAESASSLEFSPDGWVFVHPGQDVNLSLSADEASVTGYVFIRNWDVYVNGEETQERNHAVSPGIHAPVTFTGGGGVTVATGTAQTANNGRASTAYTVTSGAVGTITVQASLLGVVLEDTITVDTDADGLPDALEQRYSGSLTGLDPDATRTLNGDTDGLTWQEAYESGSLNELRNLNVAEVALRSSITPDGIYVPTGSYRLEARPLTATEAHFSGNGTETYVEYDDETGEVFQSFGDVLRTDNNPLTTSERDTYEEKKALPNTPGNYEGAEWKTAWQNNTEIVTDQYGDEVTGSDGLPLRHGSWSGQRYYQESVPDHTFLQTGVVTTNDRFETVPSPARHVNPSNVRAGRVYGSETYYFTDSGNDPNPDGIYDPVGVTRSQFDAMRNEWLTMAPPDEAARQSPHYSPNSGPLIASTAFSGDSASRLIFWIRTEDGRPAPRDLTRTYIKVTTNEAGTSVLATETVQITIRKGQVTSGYEYPQPAPGTVVRFLFVEILIPEVLKGAGGHYRETPGKLIRASKLAIGTLEHSFKPGTTFPAVLETDWIEEDHDRFYIQMNNPGWAGRGGIKVRVWTDSDGTNYDDDDRSTPDSEVVDLVEAGNTGIFKSKSMLLTSNNGDDVHVIDGIADNAKNDRTRKVALGGKLKVELLEGKLAPAYVADTEVSAPVEKTIKLHVFVAKDGNDKALATEAEIGDDLRVCRETLAQVGVKVVQSGSTVKFKPSDASISLTFGVSWSIPALTGSSTPTHATEAGKLLDWIDRHYPRGAGEARCVYVNYLENWNTGGLTFRDADFQATPRYAGTSWIEMDKKTTYVPPHEILHVLLDAQHNDYPIEHGDGRLIWTWCGNNEANGITGRKRISKYSRGFQRDKIHSSPYAK